jgi:dTDP-4-amino-4,6-dideoxygalactose transaminase
MNDQATVHETIPFNRPPVTGREAAYIAEAIEAGVLAGDGPFTRRCQQWLEERTGATALLTHSCTAALEIAALLADVGPGDEVIMPSFTFVSTANAFVLRGAIPVFVDIRPDTLNVDEARIEAAITDRTRAVVVVHYAGVGAEMESILEVADRHGLVVIEDAAQGILASRGGRDLGAIGHVGALSFHETKNLGAGEGGALLINDPALAARAAIIREKGTNRREFLRGAVDKYTWVDVGSSYVPGELIAAFLLAQLEAAPAITSARLETWKAYHRALEPLEIDGRLRRPVIPAGCAHNGHIYHVLLPTAQDRDRVLRALNDGGIQATFHYVPLHLSPKGASAGRVAGRLPHTEDLAHRLLRLPLWVGVDVQRVTTALAAAL